MLVANTVSLIHFITERIIMYPSYAFNAPSATTRSTKMPHGVHHPETGMILGPFSARCECGGVTGIGGTAKGANKWRSHQQTKKHVDWDPIYAMLRL